MMSGYFNRPGLVARSAETPAHAMQVSADIDGLKLKSELYQKANG